MPIEIDPLTGAPVVKTDGTEQPPVTVIPPIQPIAPIPPAPSVIKPISPLTAVMPAVKVEPKTVVTDTEEIIELKANMAECEVSYGGVSNIPMNHDYWGWRNRVLSYGK